MALKRPHRDWRLGAISPIDVRAVGLDQLLTRLWLRILFDNKPLVPRTGIRTVAELANEMERRSSVHFDGFDTHHGAAETWLRADLVKTLRRSPETFTVARAVHRLATRVRSVNKQTDDSFASAAVYAWLERVDRPLLGELREFIDVDVASEQVDLATFALGLLGVEQEPDVARSDEPEPSPSPVCIGQAEIYADDVRRLLAYRRVMPRAALVDHLRRLTGLHLGLYLLRVFRVVAEVEGAPTGRRTCGSCPRSAPGGGCPHRLELLVDCGEDARSPVARLAESAWKSQEDHLARYVRSHLALKKLHEFAAYLDDKGRPDRIPFGTLDEIGAVESGARREVLDLYFDQRLETLVDDATSEEEKERIRELERGYRRMGLSSFRSYVALLAHFSERRWFNYHRYLLDSLFSKQSSAEGLLRQPLGGRRRRRAALGPALLETLTLIAVVGGEPDAYYTRPVRVDQLIERLESRYGFLIGSPPAKLANDLEVSRVLAQNVDRFKGRLRETGLFTDVSDAFLAQLVRPRHVLDGAA